jgi:hypothetical protein
MTATLIVFDELERHVREEESVRAWRVEQLTRLGVSRLVAARVASLVDWHEVADLVDRGCRGDLAVEILR